MTIPRWQSHKIVEADKIVGFRARDVGEPLREDDTFLDWVLKCGDVVHVSHEMRRRAPQPAERAVGGYYMRYEDGFESWHPGDTFLKGYSPLGKFGIDPWGWLEDWLKAYAENHEGFDPVPILEWIKEQPMTTRF